MLEYVPPFLDNLWLVSTVFRKEIQEYVEKWTVKLRSIGLNIGKV